MMIHFPFTKDIHQVLIDEGYTVIGNIGYLPAIKGYALLPNQWMAIDETGKWVVSRHKQEPDDASLTDANVEYPIHSPRLQEMYISLSNDNKFYVLFERKDDVKTRLLYRKLRSTASRKLLFKTYRQRSRLY